MSNIINTNQSPDNTINITYNYYSINCENTQSSIDISGLTFISATYLGLLNHPNVMYLENGKTPLYYQATNLYVYGKVHNIPNIDYDGELIIQHLPTVSNNTKLYTCFLLKKNPFTSFSFSNNSINTLLESLHNLGQAADYNSLSMNDYIQSNGTKVIVYNSIDKNKNQCKVIINTDVIPIDQDLTQLSFNASKLFIPFPNTNSTKITTANLIDKKQEGFTINANKELISDGYDNDIFECDFLPVGTDTVTTFSIPVGSSYATDTANQEFLMLVVNYILGFIIFIAIFFLAPLFYNELMLKYICIWDFCKTPLRIFGGYTWLDFFLTTGFIVSTIILVILGVNNSNDTLKVVGVFLPFVFIIGYLGVFFMNSVMKKSRLQGTGASIEVMLAEAAAKLAGPSGPALETCKA